MTIDKEMLIKHRFWISLGVFAVIWLVGVILIPTVQGSINSDKENEYKKAQTDVEGVKDPKNDNFQNPLKAKEAELKKQKDKVWAQAYEPQSGLDTWPEGGNARLSEKLSRAYFGDYISLNDRSEYGSRLYDEYLENLHLPDMAKPVELLGGWKRVIRPVSKWDPNRPPTVEECWLAQEDLWVKRELLSIIQETLDSLRIFKEFNPETEKPDAQAPKEPAKKEADSGAVKHMRNANWELTLILERGGTAISAKSTFKNINPWKRTLSLADEHFYIRQGGETYFDFVIPVDRVAGGETADFKQPIPFKDFRVNPAKPLQIEEVFSWQTSPIKRIDALALGYNSHRTANFTCKAKPISKPSEEESKDKSGGATGSASAVEGSAGRGMGPGMTTSPMGGSGGAATASSKGLNADLQRERYLDFTDQVRWMPIGMVLVVDQQYMQDLQAHVANSRLRIQPTQVAYHRAYGIRAPAPTSTSTSSSERKDRPTTPPVGGPEIGEGVRGQSGSIRPPTTLPGGGGVLGPVGPRSGPGTNPTGTGPGAATEDDPNLMELSIYGIASLYERFPPRQQAGATQTKP